MPDTTGPSQSQGDRRAASDDTGQSNTPNARVLGTVAAVEMFSGQSPENPIIKQVISIVAGYGLLLGAFKSLKALRKSFAELREVLKEDKSADDYKPRVMEKVWECVKHAAGFVGYLASVVSIVAAVSNPFGIAIAGSTLTIITFVGLGTAFVAALADKLAKKKIASTKEFLQEAIATFEQSDLKDRLPAKRFKSIHNNLMKVKRIHDKVHGISREYRENGHKNPALFLIKQAQTHKEFLLKATDHILPQTYRDIAKSTLQKLEKFKNDPNLLIYQGISVVQQVFKHDPEGLLLKVPRIKDAALRAADSALKGGRPPQAEPAADQIERFKDKDGNVQIRMNADPSDDALCLMMGAVAKGLGPLKMKPSGDIGRILRVLEAAKLADVTVAIDPSDQSLFTKAEPHVKAYFDKLVGVSAKQFQDYVEQEVKKKGTRALGQIPERIPKSWKKMLGPTQR